MTVEHLFRVGKCFFRFVQSVKKEGFAVGHIKHPSFCMFLTIIADRMGEFLNSSPEKMRGEITTRFSRLTSHAVSNILSLTFLSSDSTSIKTSMSESSVASPRAREPNTFMETSLTCSDRRFFSSLAILISFSFTILSPGPVAKLSSASRFLRLSISSGSRNCVSGVSRRCRLRR